jgi:PASTA domain
MSEPAPERSGGGGVGGVLGRKLGPLAVWAWLAILTVGGVAYYLYAKSKSGSSSSTAADTSGTGSETPSSGVPDYVSQVTINQPQPASTPGNVTTTDVTVPNTVGQPQEAAYAIISTAGLKPATTTPPIKGTTIYVKSQSPAAGAKATKGSTVTLTSAAKTTAKKTTAPAKKPAPKKKAAS